MIAAQASPGKIVRQTFRSSCKLVTIVCLICLLSLPAAAKTWYVANGGNDVAGGGTSGSPFATLQFAISQAAGSDSISVGAGLFVGAGNRDISVSGKSLTIFSPGGPAATTFDCEGSVSNRHRAITFGAGIDSTFKLVGITFRNGYDSTGGLFYVGSGADPTFEDCRFELSEAFNGGAVFCEDASGTFKNCSFTNNNCDNLGGAVFIETGASPTFIDCDFDGNSSDNYAGVLMVGNAASGSFRNCLFAETSATWGGGMLYASGGNIDFTGCTFVKSSATWTGDVLAFANSTVSLENCLLHTIAGSEAIVCLGTSTLTIDCTNIFSTEYTGWFGACVTPYFGINGNFSAEPAFFDYGAGDYRLDSSSPCAPANNTCNVLIGSESVLPETDDCGDLDGDGMTTITDAVYGINYIFADGPNPQDSHGGDVDCSGAMIITDCVYLINYIFAHGAPPCENCK